MAMKVFLFPGQGSQEIGMAADLFKSDPAFGKLVSRASERTGADLETICRRGPARELTRTRNLQPLLVCVSLGYLRRLVERGIRADRVLGHSLGEISALAAAGIVSFETAVDIAARRGELMEAAAARAPGGMAAVLGGERAAILRLLAERLPAAPVALANDNAPDQFVLSGETAALAQAAQLIAAEKLGQCRRLAVAGPWHSPLMEPARREFSDWLAGVDFHAPEVPLIFNTTAETETRPEKIRALVAGALVSPVRWRSSLATLQAAERLVLYEIGPGRVLSGLARANGFGEAVKIINVNNLRGIELAASMG
jgi:[acyl-carrier-protein] S-malonyltransferase